MELFSKKCLLNQVCKVVDGDTCNHTCPHFVSLHGLSGNGGRIASCNVPKEYMRFTVANSPVSEEQPAIYKTLSAYINTFSRQFDEHATQIKSLYLFSDSPGTGKTTTACTLINEWVIAHYLGSLRRSVRPVERPAYFFDVNAWQGHYNAFNRPKVPDSIAEEHAEKYYRQQQLAMEAPFLVMDDVGVRSANVSEAFRADLHTIVNHRVANQMPTIYTSNIPIHELSEVFDSRLADRIRDMTAVLQFEGESKRGFR